MSKEEGSMRMPPAAQQSIIQLQTLQQQENSLAMQQEGLTIQKIELEKALDELKKITDKEDVYKAIGPVLIKSTKAALQKELGEKRETADLRLKTIEKQDEKIHEKIKELQDKLSEMLKQ